MSEKQQNIVSLALESYQQMFDDFTGQQIDVLFSEFSKYAGISPDCPSCGNDAWAVIANPDDSLTGRKDIAINMNGQMLSSFAPSILMSCDKCGFMKAHSMEPLHRWFKDVHNKGATNGG